jgi:hypothetical protein
MAAVFYQPAFAALTRWWAPEHVRVLTIVTLAGGLASTVFAPLTAILADHMSWRATYTVLAVILAVPTVPARRLGVTARTVTLIALGGVTTAALATVAGPYALLVAVSVLAGVMRGNLTLLQATAVTDRWGTTHYGRLSGLLGAPAHAAAALAPFADAVLAGPLGGHPALFALLAAASLTAAATALGTRPGSGPSG